MTFLTNLGVTLIKCSSKLDNDIREQSRFEFQEKLFANSFALSEEESNMSGLLNKGTIADLPLLRTLLAVRKLREPRPGN